MSRARILLVTTVLLLMSGCALFQAKSVTSDPGSSSSLPWTRTKKSDSQANAPILKMARLEATIVSRPANDPRIRRHVWEELDESGPMAPEVRQKLNNSGFRVGVAGSATPWALQSLAKESVIAHRGTDEQQLLQPINQMSIGPAFSLMASGKSLLEVQSQLEINKLRLNEIAELSSVRDRSNLRCVMEVSVKELSDDWVLLNILPQLHAGAVTTRLSVHSTSDQLPVRQNIIPLYEYQFDFKLLNGEVAVIGLHDSSEWNPGRLFFQPMSGSSASEKILIIRMVGIETLQGKSDPSFQLGQYDK